MRSVELLRAAIRNSFVSLGIFKVTSVFALGILKVSVLNPVFSKPVDVMEAPGPDGLNTAIYVEASISLTSMVPVEALAYISAPAETSMPMDSPGPTGYPSATVASDAE